MTSLGVWEHVRADQRFLPPVGFKVLHLHFQLCRWEDGGNWSESSAVTLSWSPVPCTAGRKTGKKKKKKTHQTNTGLFSSVSQKHSTCWNKAVRAAAAAAALSLYEPVVPPEAHLLAETIVPQKNILFLCLDPCTHWFQKGEVVGRRRENRTKQINNVMSPSRRNSFLAALLLL